MAHKYPSLWSQKEPMERGVAGVRIDGLMKPSETGKTCRLIQDKLCRENETILLIQILRGKPGSIEDVTSNVVVSDTKPDGRQLSATIGIGPDFSCDETGRARGFRQQKRTKPKVPWVAKPKDLSAIGRDVVKFTNKYGKYDERDSKHTVTITVSEAREAATGTLFKNIDMTPASYGRRNTAGCEMAFKPGRDGHIAEGSRRGHERRKQGRETAACAGKIRIR
ncbi:hypothetical protein DFH09DRAFT_1295587 [Mycena vulgaris]|nr:hypothetical protein DFH09DRAFT_1295587 [Mycena vulgaris]